MGFGPYDIKKIQLKSYLKEFFVAPNMAEVVWETAKFCMGHPSHGFFGFKFQSQMAMRQFAQACLLSCGRQLSWVSTGSFEAVEKYLDNSMLLSDYDDFDVIFIHHMAGTMKNSITGQTISQVGVARGSKKTFFFDCGGYRIQDLACRVVTLQEAATALGFGVSGSVVSGGLVGSVARPVLSGGYDSI
jgi:hypothetical protein